MRASRSMTGSAARCAQEPFRAAISCGAARLACWRGGASARWRTRRVAGHAPARRARAGRGAGRGLVPAGRSIPCSHRLVVRPPSAGARRRGGVHRGRERRCLPGGRVHAWRGGTPR